MTDLQYFLITITTKTVNSDSEYQSYFHLYYSCVDFILDEFITEADDIIDKAIGSGISTSAVIVNRVTVTEKEFLANGGM